MNTARKSPKLIAAGVAVLFFAGGAATVVAQTSGDEKFAGPEPIVAEAPKALAPEFAVFSKARTADDQLPAMAQESAAKYPVLGVNPALSHRVLTRGDRTLFAVPANDAACLVVAASDSSTMGCDRVESIGVDGREPGLILIGDRVSFYSFVPDGVDHVTVTFASGKTLDSPVENNAYLVEVATADGPTSVSYEGPNGKVSQPTTVPDLARITAQAAAE